jgi:hypothetical protein
MHRVKLYKLNTQGLWDDKGTGHVAMEFLPVRFAHPIDPRHAWRTSVVIMYESKAVLNEANYL